MHTRIDFHLRVLYYSTTIQLLSKIGKTVSQAKVSLQNLPLVKYSCSKKAKGRAPESDVRVLLNQQRIPVLPIHVPHGISSILVVHYAGDLFIHLFLIGCSSASLLSDIRTLRARCKHSSPHFWWDRGWFWWRNGSQAVGGERRSFPSTRRPTERGVDCAEFAK